MTIATDQTSCNTACNGNTTQACGGGNRLTVFQYGVKGAVAVSSSSSSSTTKLSTTTSAAAAAAATSTISSSVPSWKYLGCYTDGVGGRSLGSAVYGSGSVMTNELCQSACQKGGYTLAGMSNSKLRKFVLEKS